MRLQQRPEIVILGVMAGMLLVASTVQAESRRERVRTSTVITRPTFDPALERVELFEGIGAGQFAARVIAKDSYHGKVQISNKTDEPLTVALPKSFVAVQVVNQYGGGGGGGFGGGGGGLGGGGQGGGGGQNQAAGGGFGGGGQGGGGGGFGGGGGGGLGGGGGGFLSIPAEKSIVVPYVSACLEHGKKDPNPHVEYAIVPVEKYTQDPVLQEMIGMVATGQLDSHIAQAAIWNHTDHLSWQQLSSKVKYQLRGAPLPYFSMAQLQRAQIIAATALGRARERALQVQDNSDAETETVATEVGIR